MLPLELGYFGLFGDDLQLAPGFIALRLKPTGGKVIVARAGGVGTAGRSQGIGHHGRSRGRCRSGVPLDKPVNAKRIVRNKKEVWKEL
jgi:hypothetical protein